VIFDSLDGNPSSTETHAEPDKKGAFPMIQLLLIMAASAALPAIGKLVSALVEFVVKLVMMIFVLGLTGLVLLLLVAFAAHGRLF
jgi:hypothetical protein